MAAETAVAVVVAAAAVAAATADSSSDVLGRSVRAALRTHRLVQILDEGHLLLAHCGHVPIRALSKAHCQCSSPTASVALELWRGSNCSVDPPTTPQASWLHWQLFQENAPPARSFLCRCS